MKAATVGRRKRRWGLLAVLVAVLAVIGGAIHWGPYPWAFPLLPTLTGSWNGELLVSGQDRRYLHLQLGLATSGSGCHSDCAIKGGALICGPRGGAQDYNVRGDPRNWRGTRFYLDLYAGKLHPGRLLDTGRIDGEWHGDVLQLRARPTFATVGRDGSITSSSGGPQPPVRSWQMRRGGPAVFASGCSRLR
jgi:hypothetical protein